MIMVLGIILVFVILILVAFFGISKAKKIDFKDDKETGMMFKNLYVYLVLFATLMMSIGGSVGVFMSVADYVSPQSYYQSYEEYKLMKENETKEGKKVISEEEFKKSYEDILNHEKDLAKQRAVNGIIKSLGWIFIPFPIFLYFQRQIRRKEE